MANDYIHTLATFSTVDESGNLVSEKFRAEVRDKDGTFYQEGYGTSDAFASAVLAIEILTSALQQGDDAREEEKVELALEVLKAWAERRNDND